MSPVDDFAERFLLPLVRGGPVQVGAPLGARGLAALVEGAGEVKAARRIAEARAAAASLLLVDPPPLPLDEEALRLAVALHDLLFVTHPGSAALAVGDRLAEVTHGARAMAALPPTSDPTRLVARHTVLHRLFDLERTDVEIVFWAGRRRFRGQEPPSRLTAWRELRRVREERTTVGCVAELAGHPLGLEPVLALLAASPLTDLLHPLRAAPPLDLARLGEVLATPEACRPVAYRWLALGLERTGPRLAGALVASLDGRDPGAARFGLCLAAHLHLCLLLGAVERRGPAPTGDADAEAAARVRRLVGVDGAGRDFCGLFAALWRSAPDLALPADVRAGGDPRLLARIERHAVACAAAAGARVDELRALVARALRSAPLARAG